MYFLVVFISRNSINSDWVRLEIKHSLNRERELNRTFVIPVLLEEVDISIIKELKNKHYLILKKSDDFKSFVKKLYENLFYHLINFLEKTEKEMNKEKKTWNWTIDKDTFASIVDFSQNMPNNYLSWIQSFIEYVKNLEGTSCEFQIEKIKYKIEHLLEEWKQKSTATKNELEENKEKNNIALMIYLVGLLETEDNIVQLFEYIQIIIEKYNNNFLSCDKALSLIYGKINL